MGIVSGIVAGPCTAPVLGVLVTYVATTGMCSHLGRPSATQSFAFGMGMLQSPVGTFSGLVSAAPVGVWMVKVKKAMALS